MSAACSTALTEAPSEAVSTWVSCAYAATYGPTELSPEDVELLSSATGLQQVLAFAHAVGSNPGLLNVACSQLGSLKFAVKLPKQRLDVPVTAQMPFFALLELKDRSLDLAGTGSLGSVVSEQQKAEVRRSIARQVAGLLHIAHVLRLQPLLDVLHDWVHGAALTEGSSLLYGVLSLVFSEQVLEAAASSGTGRATAYMSSVLTRSIQFHQGAQEPGARLNPCGEFDLDGGTLSFTALALSDFVGVKALDTVEAQMDIGGTEGGGLMLVKCGRKIWLPAQLVLGPSLADAALFNAHVTP